MQPWARQGASAARLLFGCSRVSSIGVPGAQLQLRLLSTTRGGARATSKVVVAAAGLLAGAAVTAALPTQDADKWPWRSTLALAESRTRCCQEHTSDGSSVAPCSPSNNISGSSSSTSVSSGSTKTPNSSLGMQASERAGGGPLPIVKADLLPAPSVPPPISRRYTVRMQVELNTTSEVISVSLRHKYPAWTYNGAVPGPMIRCRVGDELEVIYTNLDKDGIGHNIDFHAVTGPGGGAPVLYAEQGETKAGVFKMLYPGAFVYHCAAAPVPMHIANGMYGLLLVEPAGGLPKVDKEFYVLQSEFYADDDSTAAEVLEPSYWEGLRENPTYVVFNGREGALTEQPLLTDQGDRARLFVANAGPNLVSSFHIIGCIFDKVYREGDLVSPPARGVQTTLIPAGGAAVVEVDLPVPGNYTLVDHSIFRIDKGAIGFIKVKPGQRQDQAQRADHIYHYDTRPLACPGCKLHN